MRPTLEYHRNPYAARGVGRDRAFVSVRLGSWVTESVEVWGPAVDLVRVANRCPDLNATAVGALADWLDDNLSEIRSRTRMMPATLAALPDAVRGLMTPKPVCALPKWA